MEVVASDRTGGDHGYDYWQATIRTSAKPTILWYRFIVRDGPTTRYVEDDPPADGGRGGGGQRRRGRARLRGEHRRLLADRRLRARLRDPRLGAGRLRLPGLPGPLRRRRPVEQPHARRGPGDRRREPVPLRRRLRQPDPGEGLGRSARGLLPGLPGRHLRRGARSAGTSSAATWRGSRRSSTTWPTLGVTVLYLNPIFAAPSNHRYDTSSYDVIDPDLGTQADFDRLVAEAKARGIRVLLDGVFNHVSSDSPVVRPRATLRGGRGLRGGRLRRTAPGSRSGPRSPTSPPRAPPRTAGGDDTYYVGWFGFDTIPEVVEQSGVYDLFTGPDGVVRRWVAAGTAGWRLDVMDNLSHGFLRQIRAATKAADPDALVLGEQWLDTSAWLLGDQADTTMNYRFRRAVIGLVNGDTPDLDGAIAGLPPSAFVERMRRRPGGLPGARVQRAAEPGRQPRHRAHPLDAGPRRDDPAVKESAAGLAEAKSKLRQVAALQLTWPGMASVYYGTEAGLTGHDDPDDRRPYPWDAVDTELRDWYATLGKLRRDHAALRTGGLEFLHADDAAGTLAYLRRADDEAAVVVLNLSDEEQR